MTRRNEWDAAGPGAAHGEEALLPDGYEVQVTVLPTTRESVRARPGMYFGTVDHAQALQSALLGTTRQILEGDHVVSLVDVELGALGWTMRATGPNGLEVDPEHWELQAMAAVGELAIETRRETLEVRFVPEHGVFHVPAGLEPHRVVGALRPLALAHPDVRFVTRCPDGSIGSNLEYPSASALALEMGGGRSHRIQTPWTVRAAEGPRRLDAALWWAQDGGFQQYAAVNGFHTAHAGDHITGFWAGWVDALAERARETGWQIDAVEELRSPEHLPWNTTLVLSVHWPDPTWGPATRCCLREPDCGEFVRRHAHSQLLEALRAIDPEDPLPPWQLLGGIHRKEPWLARLSQDLGGMG